tara:strand:- start:4324 stop:5331 length:1008 start_codon:yes stop_codon:yes gene_type:complete
MNILLEKNKPLLIYGKPGCGKTHIALELLKDTIMLRIDSANIKDNKDIKNYILDRIKKKNITLMFKKKTETRGLLIDDLHIFKKYDKKSYNLIIEFIKEKLYYNSKIILVCDKSLIKNNQLNKCKLNMIECKYSYSDYYKICLKIIKNKKRKFSLDILDNKIYDSKYNFNTFLSEYDNIHNINLKDNYDGNELITKNILKYDYKLDDIFRLCMGDEKIILLNLVENISHNYLEIYNFINMFNRNDIFIYYLYLLNIPIKKINDCNKKNDTNDIIYNRYISKKMVSYKNNNELNHYYLYLIDTSQKTNDIKYIDEINIKDINYHKEIYNKFKELFQ